jgi:hypothetical protein
MCTIHTSNSFIHITWSLRILNKITGAFNLDTKQCVASTTVTEQRLLRMISRWTDNGIVTMVAIICQAVISG